MCDWDLFCKVSDEWLRPWPADFLGFDIASTCCMELTDKAGRRAIVEQINSKTNSGFQLLPFSPFNVSRLAKPCDQHLDEKCALNPPESGGVRIWDEAECDEE